MASVSLRSHPSGALFAPRGPYGVGSPDSSLLQSALTSHRPLAALRFLRTRAVPLGGGVDEISQLSGKPVACVPCSMTPVESALRPMLPSTFPDGVGLHHFLYGAQSHGPLRSLSTLRPWSRPQHRKTRFQLYLRPWLGGAGYPQGFDSRFQLMAASSSTRLGLAHQGDREIGSRASPDFWVSRCRLQTRMRSALLGGNDGGWSARFREPRLAGFNRA